MLSHSAEDFDKMLVGSDISLRSLKTELTTLTSEIGNLRTREATINKKIKTEKNKTKAIKRALILVKAIPVKIYRMRNQLLSKINRVKRQDILVSEGLSLRTDIETIKGELQALCSHPFVYYEQGYEGSPSCERDNRRPDHRYCVVCGFSEDGKSKGQYDFVGISFEVLTETEERIIEKEPWTSEGRKRVDIWIPLGAVLKPFEDSVVRVLNS